MRVGDGREVMFYPAGSERMNPGEPRNQASVRNPARPLRTHEWAMMPLEEHGDGSEEGYQADSVEAEGMQPRTSPGLKRKWEV